MVGVDLERLLHHKESRKALEPLLKTGWAPVDLSHPLALLQQGAFGSLRALVLVGPENRVGARYFQVYLTRGGRLDGETAALSGLHHEGRFPQHSWVEVISIRAPGTEEEESLFRALGEVIRPGGHLMVEYESDGRGDTERALSAGVPPLLTPLGSSMFRAGCGYGFRDWYISEGGSEGPRKLQGFKPLDREHAASQARRMADEALAFLEGMGEPKTAYHIQAKRSAAELLPQLRLVGG